MFNAGYQNELNAVRRTHIIHIREERAMFLKLFPHGTQRSVPTARVGLDFDYATV
jgi:hypothetical protein